MQRILRLLLPVIESLGTVMTHTTSNQMQASIFINNV